MKLQIQSFLSYVLIFVLMIVIATDTYRGITALTETANWVSHTHQVISKAHQIEVLVAKWQNIAVQPEIAARRKIIKGAIDADYLQAILVKGVGKEILDEMRGVIDNMIAEFRKDGNVKGEVLIVTVAKAMVDQETGQRGFLITGNDEFLEPYRQGQKDLKDSITALRTLIADVYDVPDMKRGADKLEKLAADWIKEAATPEIAARVQMNKSTTSMKDVTALIEKGTGKVIMDSLRVKLNEFIGVENELSS